MTIYDRGRYATEKWRDDEVIVVLDGQRVSGRYVLFQIHGKDWMIHRMDGPPPGWTAPPELVLPMRPTRAATLPADDDAWGYELDWPGTRAIGYVNGGRLRLTVGEGGATSAYPKVRALAERLAPTECVLDGVLVDIDPAGRVGPPAGPDSHYLVVDLLWRDGVDTTELPYARRRELLAELAIAGPYWQTPPHFAGGGADVRAASREQGVPGVLAKRLDSPYLPGRRTRRWLAIPR
jgi:bifunctional non-homologous end joining protein LigD